jgi:prophage regulatory protein
MRLKEVIDTTGLARSTIYKYVGDGIFPGPISLAPAGIDMPNARSVGWIQSEVENWILARIEERDSAKVATSPPSKPSRYCQLAL